MLFLTNCIHPGASSEGESKAQTPRLMGKLSPPPMTLQQVFEGIHYQGPQGLLASLLDLQLFTHTLGCALYCLLGPHVPYFSSTPITFLPHAFVIPIHHT